MDVRLAVGPELGPQVVHGKEQDVGLARCVRGSAKRRRMTASTGQARWQPSARAFSWLGSLVMSNAENRLMPLRLSSLFNRVTNRGRDEHRVPRLSFPRLALPSGKRKVPSLNCDRRISLADPLQPCVACGEVRQSKASLRGSSPCTANARANTAATARRPHPGCRPWPRSPRWSLPSRS